MSFNLIYRFNLILNALIKLREGIKEALSDVINLNQFVCE